MTREEGRIDVVTWLLNEIWKRQPDTRFFQLIHNLQAEYSELNDHYGRETVYRMDKHTYGLYFGTLPVYDLYNLEEEEFIRFLKEKLDATNK